MSRVVTVASILALALATVGCNRPTAKDSSLVWVDLLEAGDGVFGRGINLGAAAGPQVRDMETSMEIRLSVLADAESQPRVDMSVLDSFDNPRNASTSDGVAEIVIDGGFSGCDGPGFRIRDDGGCDWEAGVLLLSDQAHSVTLRYTLKAWAADEWAGDPDSVEVIVATSVVEPE